jgi:hypothetical protein
MIPTITTRFSALLAMLFLLFTPALAAVYTVTPDMSP